MRSRSRARRRTVLTSHIVLVSLAAAGWSCGELLNVDGIEIVSGGSGGAPPAPPPRCQPGELSCVGAALQLCDDAEGAFRTVRVCSTAELCCADPARCAAPGCLAPACAAGDLRCDGAALEECNAGQTGFVEIDRCQSALHCNASLGRCSDAPCDAVAREQQCSGPELQECLPGRDDWVLRESCETHALCGEGGQAGATCAEPDCRIGGAASSPSPYQCVGGDLLRCNDAQTAWEHVETCLNTANCNALLDALAGDPYAPDMSLAELSRLGCSEPGCAPGRHQCDGARLMLCNANRTGYLDLITVCDSARHCDASAGRCTAQPCSVGQRQCSGDRYEVCTEAGWELAQRCEPGAPCDAQTGCAEPQCRPNEYRCDGAELERCNVDRTGWIPVQACASPALCNVAARRCDVPVCVAGQARCTAEGALQRCRPGRDGWNVETECAAGLSAGAAASATCDPSGGGRCVGLGACAAGSLRCNDAALERCSEGRWRPHARCATPAQCDASAGECQPLLCEPHSYRCVDPEDPTIVAEGAAPAPGFTLQVCNPAGTAFDTLRACSPFELCDARHGQCDLCDPAFPLVCASDALLVCTADGQERTLYKVCAEGCRDPDATSRATCLEDLPR